MLVYEALWLHKYNVSGKWAAENRDAPGRTIEKNDTIINNTL